jgi:hypothetical protein
MSSFTISTSVGQKVTVNEASSTIYRKGTNWIAAGAIKIGESVIVLGRSYGSSSHLSLGNGTGKNICTSNGEYDIRRVGH